MRQSRYLLIPILFFLVSLRPVVLGAAGCARRSAILTDHDRPADERPAKLRIITRSSAWFAAAEGSGSSHEELYKWVNFLIMVGVLAYFMRKPLSNFFSDRLDSIQQALSKGKRAAEASEAKLAEIQRKLANVQREIEAFRADSEREMQAERERLKQSAGVEAQRIVDFAQVQIEAATGLAKVELKKYAARQAVEMADAMVRERMDDSVRQRLVGNFVAGLKSKTETRN